MSPRPCLFLNQITVYISFKKTWNLLYETIMKYWQDISLFKKMYLFNKDQYIFIPVSDAASKYNVVSFFVAKRTIQYEDMDFVYHFITKTTFVLIFSGVLDEEIRIVIVGKGCSVKREISDAILGKNVFETDSLRRRRFLSQTDAAPVISQLQRDRYVDSMFGKVFIVTTTPDFTGSPINAMPDYTPKFLAMTSPGPHIIILAVETSSSAESVNYDEMVEPFTHVFGKSIHQYFAVILDKRKDGLFQNIFDNSPICQKLVRQGRLLYFEKQKRNRLVVDILQIVQQIRKETTEPYFSNNLFLKTEEILKQKSLEQYDNQLDKVRQHEVEIASLKAKLSFLEREQDIIKDLNTRESAIQHFDINEFKHIFNI